MCLHTPSTFQGNHSNDALDALWSAPSQSSFSGLGACLESPQGASPPAIPLVAVHSIRVLQERTDTSRDGGSIGPQK